jgi:hypothetical protein
MHLVGPSPAGLAGHFFPTADDSAAAKLSPRFGAEPVSGRPADDTSNGTERFLSNYIAMR